MALKVSQQTVSLIDKNTSLPAQPVLTTAVEFGPENIASVYVPRPTKKK